MTPEQETETPRVNCELLEKLLPLSASSEASPSAPPDLHQPHQMVSVPSRTDRKQKHVTSSGTIHYLLTAFYSVILNLLYPTCLGAECFEF